MMSPLGSLTWILFLFGFLFIFVGFVLLAVRKIIFWVILSLGLGFAALFTIMIMQVIHFPICGLGFFGGLAIYVVAWAYAAKRIILANAIQCFAIGSLLVLSPLLFLGGGAMYVLGIVWFCMTFLLFYFSVQAQRKIKKVILRWFRDLKSDPHGGDDY